MKTDQFMNGYFEAFSIPRYNSLVQEGCPVHDNRAIEFFCEVDNQLTCSYCMLMGEHVGHQVKTLVDKACSFVSFLK